VSKPRVSDPKAIIWAAKSWAARRAPVKVSLSEGTGRNRPRKKEIDVRAETRKRLAALRRAQRKRGQAEYPRPWHAPGVDPEDVTGGNGDG
jgi:hypothetical protein